MTSIVPKRVVALAGSLSAKSSTALVLEQALADIPSDISTDLIAINQLPSAALVGQEADNPFLLDALAKVAEADGVIFGTPIYKSSLSGLSKAFLDLLPQYGFAGKTIWPIATGGSIAHALALDCSVRPILQSMGARQIIQSVFFSPQDFAELKDGDLRNLLEANPRYAEASRHFASALAMEPPLLLLGHPMPQRETHLSERLSK